MNFPLLYVRYFCTSVTILEVLLHAVELLKDILILLVPAFKIFFFFLGDTVSI